MAERKIALDILKLTMAFMVVGLHSHFLDDFSAAGEWLSVNGIFRIAVPLFFIINGYYFFDVVRRREFAPWLKRIFVLYAFWMSVYSPFWLHMNNMSPGTLARIGITLLSGYYHLWYVSAMAGAAILVAATNKISVKITGQLALALFATGVALQYAGNYHVLEGIGDKIANIDLVHRNFLFFGFPFFYFGYLSNQLLLVGRFEQRFLMLGILLGLTLLVAESALNFIYQTGDGGFDNYASLIIVCPFLFLFFMGIDLPGEVKGISLYASAIYFVHILVLLLVKDQFEMGGTQLAFVVSAVSVVVAFFLVRIPPQARVML